jgi:hypothetical protein
MGIPSALSALEAAGATEILIRYRVDRVGDYVVTAEFPPGVAHALGVTRGAETLQKAFGLVVEAISSGGEIRIFHAAQRATVRLPDGGLGTLVFVAKDGGMATVVSSEGRHRTLPVVLLKLADEPSSEPGSRVK